MVMGGYASGSDCVDTPFAVECKRSARPGPPVLSKWVTQAKSQGRKEKKPWLLVVANHNDRRPIVVLDFWAFAQLAQEAGRIPTPLTNDEPITYPPPRSETSEPAG